MGTFPKSAGELNAGKSNTGARLSADEFDVNKYVELLLKIGSPGMVYVEVESGAGAMLS